MSTIVITGASQGIGRAVALAYAARASTAPGASGVRLALLARNAEALEATAAACRALGAKADGFVCDVTDDAAVERASGDVLARLGTPDVLVNNAGAFVPGGFLETTPEAFRAQVEVNLTSAFLVTRAFLPAMLARAETGPASSLEASGASGSSTRPEGDPTAATSPEASVPLPSSPIPRPPAAGDIVFMASVASTRGYPGGTAYGAAKHGLLGLARTLREETKDRGLRVITVLPGATLTPSWDGVDVPKERLMPPEAIAQAVVAATSLPRGAVVEELLIRPQEGDL
ncbi:MAG: SDR family oxidoreductase [Bacteroidota bacterium]